MTNTTLTTPEVEDAAGSVPRAEEARTRRPTERKKELPTYIKHRRREPNEVVTRSASTQAFCRECVGWDADGCGSVAANVRSCTCEGCWLYPWRNGKVDY